MSRKLLHQFALLNIVYLLVSLPSYLYASDSVETIREMEEATVSSDHEFICRDLKSHYTYTPSPFSYGEKEDGSFYTEPYIPSVSFSEGGGGEKEITLPDQASSAETVLMRIIPDKDGRNPIINPALWPYRAHAQLNITFDDEEYGGSGTLVGPSHLLTAGHNVFSSRTREWASKILITCALNGSDRPPFNQQQTIRVYTYKKWVNESDQNYDMALIVLDEPIGRKIGWYGLSYLPPEIFTPRPIYIQGYPMEVSGTSYPDHETAKIGKFKKMWGMSHDRVDISPQKLYYQIDTSSGQSGSSIWYEEGDKKYIVGVHAYGENEFGKGNYGVRITKQKVNDIIKWVSETIGILPTGGEESKDGSK